MAAVLLPPAALLFSMAPIHQATASIHPITGTGNGGIVTITTTSPLVFTVGGGGNLTGNGTAGNINANGVNGGFITATNYGNSTTGNQIINGSITANGTTGNGGTILFQGQQPAGSTPLTTIFNSGSLVQATNNANNSGLIGLNAGAGQNIGLAGTGIVHAGSTVRIGALNPSTLALLNVPGGTVNISSGITIGNAIETNGFIPSPPPLSVLSVLSTLSVSPPLVSPIGIPASAISQTATDQTQILSYTNLNKNMVEMAETNDADSAAIVAHANSSRYIEGTTIYAYNFGGEEIHRLANDGVVLAQDSGDNYLNLQHGNIVLTPDRKILVSTNESKIYIASGASVFIMKSDNELVLYDLLQTQPNQVSVLVNTQKIAMQPGQMLVLTRQNVQNFEKLDASCRKVAYTNAQPLNVTGNIKAFIAHFSITSALVKIEPLQRLTTSNFHHDKLALNKLLKGAIIQGDSVDIASLFENADMGR